VQSGSSYTISPQAGSSLLVADEVHRMAADKFSLALESNFGHRLGLSATWQRNDNKHEIVLQPYFDGVVFTLNYARARRENAISNFRMALVGVQLSQAERGEYEEASMKARKYKNRLIAQFGAPSEPFDALMTWVNAAKSGQVPGAEKLAGFYLSAFQKQRAVLAESSAKLICTKGLAPAVRAANRTLGFTSTIEAAKAIDRIWSSVGLLSRTYHSRLSSSERKYLMSEFRDGRLKALVAPKVLDEGIDVPDVDLGLIMGTSHSRIQLVQRIGRVLRRKPSGAKARICLLYVIDTPEDPDRGAHEVALADIRQAADEIETFVYPDDQKEILAFLGP
jgi:superfamily II DNA or RNA helicase